MSKRTPPAPPTQPVIPDVPRDESDAAFLKMLEEVELDDEDAAAINDRAALLSDEGEPEP